jgi:peptide chain release factor 1
MFKKLEELEKHYNEITKKLSQEEVIKNQQEFQKLAIERAELEIIVNKLNEYRRLEEELAGAKEILTGSDDEMKDMAKEEIETLEQDIIKVKEELKKLLIPKDPRDKKNVVVEIRAGAGGEEAALFASQLFRMYSRFAEKKHLKMEVISTNSTGIGGIKEVIFSISGGQVYSLLKFESGVHRVQRVPATEASGRIHTSTVTVAVMPEVDEVEIKIDPKDIRIDIFHAGGHGGQNVNKLETAIRITHFPSGIVVNCQDERSQLQNKLRAMQILRVRLQEKYEQEQHDKLSSEKKKQLGSGDRSEKIRTYNFPQSRITDHRIGFTAYNLLEVLDGDLDELIEALHIAEQEQKLKELGKIQED